MMAGRPPGPDDADAVVAVGGRSCNRARQGSSSRRIRVEIRDLAGIVSGRAMQARQAGQRTIGCERRTAVPMIDDSSPMDLPEQRMQDRIGHDHHAGAASAGPWDIAAELDRVAKTLVGDQEQRRVRQRRSIPLRRLFGGSSGAAPAIRYRHSYSFQPSANSPRSKSASANWKCGPVPQGQSRKRGGRRRCSDRAPIYDMGDRQIVQRLEIVGIPLERLIPNTQVRRRNAQPLKMGQRLRRNPIVSGAKPTERSIIAAAAWWPPIRKQHPFWWSALGSSGAADRMWSRILSASGSRPFSENSPAIVSSSSSGTATFGIVDCRATGDDDAINPGSNTKLRLMQRIAGSRRLQGLPVVPVSQRRFIVERRRRRPAGGAVRKAELFAV